MNAGKRAFAVCAAGDRYAIYRRNLVSGLRMAAPGVDIIDIDPYRAKEILGGACEKDAAMSARLAIPLMDEFKGYDRVVWVDTDVDIVSKRFADVLEVDTGPDGLAASPDINQDLFMDYMSKKFPGYDRPVYCNSGVLAMELRKINPEEWRHKIAKAMEDHRIKRYKWPDQDILNGNFRLAEMDARYNWIWRRGCEDRTGPWAVHYADTEGHRRLDALIRMREGFCDGRLDWHDRCVVLSPRHAFIRPWIRAYFASGNRIPLVIVPGPPVDWKDGDMEYCQKAAEYCGGLVFDCSGEWEVSRRLAERAVLKDRVGWYSKKSILHAVAVRLAPASWAWIDDDAEVTGDIEECFRYAEKAPGFVYTQFYCPDEIDDRHPESMYRSNIGTGDKISWNSFMFFHGEANERMAESLGRDLPVEDDEIVFGDLYKSDPRWHEGFCDFSIRRWQAICKKPSSIPEKWSGKVLHYTSWNQGGAVKKMWAQKAEILPPAPFEPSVRDPGKSFQDDGSVDAVFVIGGGDRGSSHDNEELRYALRNLEKNCRFVRDVYICGYCPPWVDKSRVKHLQWPDRFEHAKDANIVDKLRHACEVRGIAKRILFCSDDQFQTRECSWDDFEPRYLKRYQSNDAWYERLGRVWHVRLMKTLEREVSRRKSEGLEACDVFYYQPHMWMQIDRDRFLDYAKWSRYETRDDAIIASGYFNFADVGGKWDFDHAFPAGEFKVLPEATHIAYCDSTYDSIMPILRKMFPEKSRFEL